MPLTIEQQRALAIAQAKRKRAEAEAGPSDRTAPPIQYGVDPGRVREMYDAKFKENAAPDGVTPPPPLWEAPVNVAKALVSPDEARARALVERRIDGVGPRTPDMTRAPISEQQLNSQSYWNAEKPPEPMTNPLKRAARNATNVLSETVNMGLEAFDYGRGALEPGPRIPMLDVPKPQNSDQAIADGVGTIGGLVMPLGPISAGARAGGQALRSTGFIGRTAAALTPQGTNALSKATRFAGRTAAMVPEAAATAFGAGAILGGENMGGDGNRLQSGVEFASDPINYLAQPVAMLINRAAIFIKTAGQRVTPEVVQVQRAAEVLRQANSTAAQKEAAAKVIDELTPPASQPAPFSAPAEPKPSSFLANNADRIASGAVGGFLGSAGDAFAASGGDGNGGPDVINPITGAAAGMFLPRAAMRGYRAAGSAIRGGGFDEAVAVRRVRNLLAPVGRSADEIRAANIAQYGDKPSVLADQTQNAQNFSVNLSRQSGIAPELASQQSADLARTRSGRLFSDVETTTNINPATVTADLDAAIKQASEEISPAYEALFAKHAGINSERLMQLADDPIVGQYVRAAIKEAESLQTTAGQAPSNARTWDLVKRGLDRTIESQKRSGGQASYALEQARAAVKNELDALMPEYKAVRDGADAPRMRDARKQGAKIAGGGLSVEQVRAIASKLTGKPLTALQMGAVEKIVLDIEKARGLDGLSSERMREVFGAVFSQDTADKLVARIRADQTILKNAQRRDPDFGSATSQAGMADRGMGALAADAFRAVRNPLEAALAALSRSGAYTQDQRNRIAEMLYSGATDENLARIYGNRPPRNPLNVEPPPTPQGPPTNALAPRRPEQAGFGSRDLPMDEGSRMERARSMGFDVDTQLYHGTSKDFEEFRPSAFGELGPGVYVSRDPRYVETFAARKSDGGAVLPLFAKKGQWIKSDKYEDLTDELMATGVADRRTAQKQLSERLQAEGYLGIDGGGFGQWVVFDPSNIRGKFAKFDPSESSSSKLLAGMSGNPEAIGAAGGTAIGMATAPDQNGDGVVDAQERLLGGAGGALTGGIVGRGVRGGMNALAPRGPDQAGLFGSGRPKAPPAFDQRFMTEAQRLVSYNGGVDKALKAQQYVIDQLKNSKAPNAQDRLNRAVSIQYAIRRMAERSNRELDQIVPMRDAPATGPKPIDPNTNYNIDPRGDKFIIRTDAGEEVLGAPQFTDRKQALAWLQGETRKARQTTARSPAP